MAQETTLGITRHNRAVAPSTKSVRTTECENIPGNVKQPKRKFAWTMSACKGGMINALYFLFSDISQNFDGWPNGVDSVSCM
jgi:hypothetical protein